MQAHSKRFRLYYNSTEKHYQGYEAMHETLKIQKNKTKTVRSKIMTRKVSLKSIIISKRYAVVKIAGNEVFKR